DPTQAATGEVGPRRGGRRAALAARIRPRTVALVAVESHGPARAISEPRTRPADKSAEGRSGDRPTPGQLPRRRPRPGGCRRRSRAARARHEGEPSIPARGRSRALAADERSVDPAALRGYLGHPQRPSLSSAGVKVLIVTMYFPPSGGGGVQRPLKFATHL